MDLCKMNLEQIKEYIDRLEARCAALDETEPAPRKGQYVIVRCRDAGVHAGVLVDVDRQARTIRLAQSRRLWRWWSRFTLSELAALGVRQDKADECRFAIHMPETIELAGWCEILPCSVVAERTIRAVQNANE